MFQSDRDGDLAIYWPQADGSGTAERLTRPEAGTAHNNLSEGRHVVYVEPFPRTGARYQISRDDDGHHAVWSRDGRTFHTSTIEARESARSADG